MPNAKDVLQGKPLRCPVHPALVHFPIGLFALGFLLDLATWIFSRPELHLVRSAFIAYAAGLGTAALAAIPGFVDYTSIRDDHPAKKTATLHMVLNLVALALFAVSLGLRYEELDLSRVAAVPLLVALIALGILSYSGYLGGCMVYDDGVGVGRHRRSTRLPEKTLEPPARNDGDEIAVLGADALADGETARVDLRGTIITLAKVDGEFFAFQEFCTHRYGPLSEGKIEHGQVECPWHCSRFDVATGKVCEGPAKVDLRTFPVTVRDGKVWLRTPAPASDAAAASGG